MGPALEIKEYRVLSLFDKFFVTNQAGMWTVGSASYLIMISDKQ
jgi:hypothetical protein